MTKKLKHKALTITTILLITALTTGIGMYIGLHIHATGPEALLAQAAVPVGVGTMQQVLLMAWDEFSEQLKKTCIG